MRKAVLREPLVHFLLLGGLLFLFFEWRGGSGPGSSRIAITPGLVEHLASGFAHTWQRPPTDAELRGLLDDYVKEEIATREAVGMGLDRDDTIIRRRLRQKLEFLVEDAASSSAPTDAELQAWLHKHEAGTDHLGDASMLPAEQPLLPLREAERSFGGEFAQELVKLDAGEWKGPVESPYGLRLVLIRERIAAAQPSLAEVRPTVEREVLAERRKKDLERLYERLLEKYTVTIEKPKPTKAPLASPVSSGSR